MARPLLILPALAALTLAMGAASVAAKTDPGATIAEEDAQTVPDKIREKLSAEGYQDITVMPTSYAVSATDKEGKPVLLLIGPSGSTPLREEAPSTAQSPPGKNERIQQ
jgi:hypothetical protein